MKRLIIFIIVILLAGGVLFWRYKSSSKPLLKTERVKIGSITKTISASGRVASEEEAELKFQTSGQLAWVGVKEGDHVQAWQAIAQLDTRELQKTLEKYLRDYSKERNDFEEDRRVTYGKFSPQDALTDTVKRILEKNQWDLEKAVLDVELKDIALKFATLVTPISGIITHVDMPVAGVNITPATAVFKVANPEKMVFKANIDEADIAEIVPSLPVKITLDAYPGEEYGGAVNKVGFASVTTSGGGTAFSVEVSLPKNDNLKFRIGMNGDVEIAIQQKNDTLIIPNTSLVSQNGKSYVFKIKNGQPVKTKITTGLQDEKNTEVTEGLKEGEKVVTENISSLKK